MWLFTGLVLWSLSNSWAAPFAAAQCKTPLWLILPLLCTISNIKLSKRRWLESKQINNCEKVLENAAHFIYRASGLAPDATRAQMLEFAMDKLAYFQCFKCKVTSHFLLLSFPSVELSCCTETLLRRSSWVHASRRSCSLWSLRGNSYHCFQQLSNTINLMRLPS